jgi:integrase
MIATLEIVGRHRNPRSRWTVHPSPRRPDTYTGLLDGKHPFQVGLHVHHRPTTCDRLGECRFKPAHRGFTVRVLALRIRVIDEHHQPAARPSRALLGLLGLQALRTVEITRANVEDLQRRGESWALLVHGKFHDRLVFLRPDVAAAMRAYLAARGTNPPYELGEALLVADGNFARGHRLSRRGVRHVVDGYMRAANVKRPRVSNHALRHTSATLAYRYTRDLRAVQDMLGHQDPKTTARYARVVDRAQANPALQVPVDL